MAIRMTGLQSGLDTESIVEQLMEAERTKQTKVENKKTKLEWKQEIWSGLNTKIKNFYSTWASKMRLQTNYKTKKATSSNENKLTATAGTNAVNGTYKVQVNKLATSQYVTGSRLGGDVKSSSKLSELMGESFKEGSEITITNGDKSATLIVDSTTTVSDFVASCKQTGLSASFDEKQQRMLIGASKQGEEGKFTITASQSSDDVVNTRNALREAVDYSNLSSSNKTAFNNAVSDLLAYADSDDEAELDLYNAATEKIDELLESAAKTKAQSYLKSEYTDSITNEYAYTIDEGTGEFSFTTDSAAKEEELKEFSKMSDEDYNALTADDKKALVEKMVNSKVSEAMKSDEAEAKLNDYMENGITDALSGSVILKSRAERTADFATMLEEYGAAEEADTSAGSSDVLSVLGMENVDGSQMNEKPDGSGMVVIAAQQAEVVVNGATMTSSSNSIEVNGLTLELKDTSAEAITLTVDSDTDAVYDTVKEFIKEYNALLKEMNTLYYADRAKDYEPLTDEQKEEMSDDEVEKWEKKIKDSLLRRDDSLEGVINIMKNSMMGTVDIDGKQYSLASLGIMTSTDYSEKGLLHIYGDADDEVYADKTNKLKKMIEEDPDLVTKILSGLSTNLYNSMTTKMRSSSLNSSMTFYNDKQMKSQLSDYKKEISEWEEKLKDIEDRYYSQFTAMEKAMASLSSQQTALSGLM